MSKARQTITKIELCAANGKQVPSQKLHFSMQWPELYERWRLRLLGSAGAQSFVVPFCFVQLRARLKRRSIFVFLLCYFSVSRLALVPTLYIFILFATFQVFSDASACLWRTSCCAPGFSKRFSSSKKQLWFFAGVGFSMQQIAWARPSTLDQKTPRLSPRAWLIQGRPGHLLFHPRPPSVFSFQAYAWLVWI